MKKITILDLLQRYHTWVSNGQVQFLQRSTPGGQKEILAGLSSLISDFERAAREQRKNGRDISEIMDWHETHKKGRSLWEKLLSSALSYIDPESKGNSRIFEYLEAATGFEDLLYGLEEYYRDHTLHSLWVYLIGEHILRDHLPRVHADLNWYIINDIEKEESSYSPKLFEEAKDKEKQLCKEVNKKRDSIWCVMALCHDLGYSLEKLGKLNERVRNVLQFVDLPNFQQIGYSLDIEHQYHVSQFLELMAMEMRIVPSEDLKNVLIKGYRDDSTYWRLCRAFEQKKYGILSSYLIYKILHIFADSWVRGPAEEWGLQNDEAVDNIIRGDILHGIAQHEFDFAYLHELSSLADILVLADELEEFSRYGRPMSSRKYYDTTADAAITFKRNKNAIEIEITYEMAKHQDNKQYYKFFVDKAERLCELYSLSEEDGSTRYPLIRSLRMIVMRQDKTLSFYRKGAIYRAYLPRTKLDGKVYEAGERDLDCIDDKLRVKEINTPVRIWVENAIE